MWLKKRDSLLQELPKRDALRFIDSSSWLGTRWLHAIPFSYRTTIRDINFCGAIADKLLQTDIHGSHGGRAIFRHESIKKFLKEAYEQVGCKVAMEPQQEGGSSRGDLHVRGLFAEGKRVIDISIALTSGAAGRNPANSNISAPQNSVAVLNTTINKCAERRYMDKIRKYQGKTFGGTLMPFIITAGGTMHPLVEDFMEKLKRKNRKVHDELGWHISIALMIYRARVSSDPIVNG